MRPTYLLSSALLCGLLCVGCSPQLNSQMWLKQKFVDQTDYVLDTARYEQYRAIADSLKILPVKQVTATENNMYHHLYHHGIAFESREMAYRIYFDDKQTIDVYAKRTPRMELEQSLWYPNDEQLAQHFGDDVLRVSGAIGVGAVKPWNGKKMVHIDKYASRTERIVERSRKRTVQEIIVRGWQTEGKTVDMTVRYTQLRGHRDVIAEVFLSEPLQHLVTGVQKIPLKSHPVSTDPADPRSSALLRDSCLLGSWGTDWPVTDTVKYARETIGLGVYVPQQYVHRSLEDVRNILIEFQPVTYMKFYLTVVAQKEDNPPARNQADFFAYLRRWQQKIEKK